MTALIIGPDEKKVIAEIIERATMSPVTFETVRALAAQFKELQGKSPMFNDQTADLPMGFRVTYSHEFHRPTVLCRHLSVSVNRDNRVPNPAVIQTLMTEFGFINPFGRSAMYTETLERGRLAVSVIEPISGDMKELSDPIEGATQGD